MREDQNRPDDIETTTPAGDPWSADELSQAQQWAQQYYTSHGIPAGYGQVQDLVNNYQQQRRNGVGHQAAMDTVPGLIGWDKYQKPQDPGPGPQPPPTPGGGGGTTNTGLGSLFTPFGQSYTKPAPVNLGGPAGIEYIPQVPQLNLPQYKPPPEFHYDDFVMPGANDVYQDPSYALRRDEGQRGIESSAAAQGRVRTGGTLNDILKYNQGFASSEFGNIVDRKFKQYETNRNNAVDTYRTNYATQYVDPYTFDVQAAKDKFAPNFSQWQVQGQAGQRQNELSTDQSWAQFLQNYRQFDDDRKFKYGALSDQERIGLDAATR